MQALIIAQVRGRLELTKLERVSPAMRAQLTAPGALSPWFAEARALVPLQVFERLPRDVAYKAIYRTARAHRAMLGELRDFHGAVALDVLDRFGPGRPSQFWAFNLPWVGHGSDDRGAQSRRHGPHPAAPPIARFIGHSIGRHARRLHAAEVLAEAPRPRP